MLNHCAVNIVRRFCYIEEKERLENPPNVHKKDLCNEGKIYVVGWRAASRNALKAKKLLNRKFNLSNGLSLSVSLSFNDPAQTNVVC